ncbi:uncharacterized protein LOC123552612 [Mercenaria mercenaria]|uniref:uncharacterized protein LOC123552612 n=1 Tax=Mercenaria mercenaria TaxID=6596 RepID=UPI00234EB6F6|nr:uncharacterized protein LOC123552612 [Mercenaria mercenaria]
MKCSNTSCGWQGQCNFCQSCGNKMMPFAQEEIFITCSGTLDGKVCGSELKQSQKFCTKCGTRIDKSLFASQQEICNECGTILNADFSFCQECGLKRGSVVRLDSHGKEKQSKNTSASDEKPVSPIEKKSHTSSLNVIQSNTLPLDPNGIEVSTEGASANEQDERRVGNITSENAHVSSSNDDVITAFSDESVENVHSQLGYSSVLLNESNEDATFTQDGKSVEDEASDKARAVCSDASAIFDGGGDSISVENPSFHTQIVDPMYDTWTATVENSSQRVNEQKDDHVTCSYASAKSDEEGDSHNIENVQSSCGTLDVVTMTDEGKEDVNTNDEQGSEKTVLGKQIIEGDKEREGRSILKTTVETPAINGVETDENANIESNGAASNETDLSQTEDNSDLKQMLDTCDQETQSLEAQSLDYSCDKSGRDEKTKENIAHKRKHEDNRGSSKAKSIKKRDRKNRSHADKFSLSTQVRRQKEAGLKKNCNAATEAGTEIVSDGKEEESSLIKGHNDDLSKFSTENADFVFGPVNRNVNNQRYSDIVEKYSVINPPDPSKPSFFQQPEITKISQEPKDRTNCENKLDETSTSNGKILSDEQKRPNLESDVRQHMETDGETKVEKKTKVCFIRRVYTFLHEVFSENRLFHSCAIFMLPHHFFGRADKRLQVV